MPSDKIYGRVVGFLYDLLVSQCVDEEISYFIKITYGQSNMMYAMGDVVRFLVIHSIVPSEICLEVNLQNV